MSVFNDLVATVWATLLELSPWLLVGTAVAGILHGLLPRDFVRRHLGGSSGVLKAVALGVPLPLCSCGVIPAGLGLRKDGASRGAAIGFLTSTPQTGVDSILVSASFLGWPFALFKVAAALVSGLLSGWLVNAVTRNEPAEIAGGKIASDGAAEPHGTGSSVAIEPGGTARLQRMVDHSLEILRSIWRWLVFGVLLSAAIQVFVPDSWLHGLGSLGSLGAGLAALAVSLPLYVCAVASVPIAAALVAGGMPAGAALVFLMAGPATNLATLGAVFQGFGGKSLSIYLGTLVVFSLGAGVLFEQLVPNVTSLVGAHQHETSLWALVSTLVLLGLLLWFASEDLGRLWRKWQVGNRTKAASDDNQAIAIAVEGMTCNGCTSSLERALRRLPGVDAVSVQLDPGCATINGSIAQAQLVEAIEQAGFTARP